MSTASEQAGSVPVALWTLEVGMKKRYYGGCGTNEVPKTTKQKEIL